MNIKDVKFASEVEESGEACTENTDVCEISEDLLHVWFEDGTTVTVCKSCFDKHVNEGNWITDRTDHLKPT